MVSTCDCIKLTILCTDQPSVEIYMDSIGYNDTKPLYVGTYNGDTYVLIYESGTYYFHLISDPVNYYFSNTAPFVISPCGLNPNSWVTGPGSFCEVDILEGIILIDDLTNEENPNCGKTFTGDCSCKTIETTDKCLLFYKTCDGNIVEQNINGIDTINGCFIGTPIIIPTTNGTVSNFTASTCEYFCLTGETCCLNVTAVTETQTITTTVNPTGSIDGYPFFVLSATSQLDIIIRFQGVGWVAECVMPTLGNKTFFSLSSTDFCPVGNWTYLFGPVTQLITEEITCPLPSPTPTPTPTPTNTPTPTPIPKPPLTPKVFDLVNECTVITLFPMGVECVITNPSPESSDGSLFLKITGGTPPYTITWEDGNIGPNLYNLTAGTYKAIVTDYYKDFTANTNCTLTGSTPVPSPTPTPTPTPPYVEYNLCMQTSIVKGEDTINEDTPFVPNGILNGRPSWISFDSTSIMYWNDENSNWVVSSSTNSDVIICANPAYPPIYGSWFILGNGTVYVSSGSCESEIALTNSNGYSIVIGQPLRLSVSTNNPICGCDGNITLVANGGTPPYLYTINSGLNYNTFPIFNDLCSGVYTVKVKDSTNLEVNSSAILNPPNRPVTYSVALNTSNKVVSLGSLEKIIEYTTVLSVSPELPEGVTLTFDLTQMNVSQTSPNFSSSTFVNSSSLSVNNIIQPIYVSVETGTTFNVLAGCQNNTTYKTITMRNWYGVQFDNTTNLVISTITETYKNEETNCYLGLSDDTFQISNISINGCYCCNVVAS